MTVHLYAVKANGRSKQPPLSLLLDPIHSFPQPALFPWKGTKHRSPWTPPVHVHVRGHGHSRKCCLFIAFLRQREIFTIRIFHRHILLLLYYLSEVTEKSVCQHTEGELQPAQWPLLQNHSLGLCTTFLLPCLLGNGNVVAHDYGQAVNRRAQI